jgi:REP element-mobilizing transposase RayT
MVLRRIPCGDMIAYEEWKRNTAIRPNISFDAFILMPNHLHGILVFHPHHQSNHSFVRALHATPLPPTRMSSISPKPRSLGTVIRSYKSAVTRWARRHGYPEFSWKRGYYDPRLRGANGTSSATTATSPPVCAGRTAHPPLHPPQPHPLGPRSLSHIEHCSYCCRCVS